MTTASTTPSSPPPPSSSSSSPEVREDKKSAADHPGGNIGHDQCESDLLSNDEEFVELNDVPLGTNGDEDRTSSSENGDKIADRNHRLSIESLMETNQRQQEEILNLKLELNQLTVQHKEGIYWLQMQLDTTRREKVAIEESMAELQEDVKDMAIHGSGASDNDTHAQKRKFELSLGTFENQMNMIKTSFGEINRSLKEEICDLMEDRTQIELNLLNQLSALDDERRKKELEFTIQLAEKEDQLVQKEKDIQRLRQERPPASLPRSEDNNDNYSTATSILSFDDDNPLSILEFLQTKGGQNDELLARERKEADELINDLKDQKIELEQQLEAAEYDISVMRSQTTKNENAKQLLSRLELQKEAINSTLDRVMSIKESADTTIQSLSEIIDKLRTDDESEDENEGNRKCAISVLESASLLNATIKVSLLHVEMQLRNHLEQVNHCGSPNSRQETDHVNEDHIKKLEEMNHEALAALKHVETALFQQMSDLEEGILKENSTLKKRLAELQNDSTELMAELTMLRKGAHSSSDFNKSQETALTRSTVSDHMMDQLSMEVFRVVAIFSSLKETIANLKMELAKHVKREDNLRKELKRVIRAKAVPDGTSPRNVGVTTPTSRRSSLMAVHQIVRKNSDALKVPFLGNEPESPSAFESSSPFATPTQSGSSKRRNSTGSAIIVSSPSSIRPIKPSPKELFKSRQLGHHNSQFPVNAPPFSPVKSPTGVEAGLFEDLGV